MLRGVAYTRALLGVPSHCASEGEEPGILPCHGLPLCMLLPVLMSTPVVPWTAASGLAHRYLKSQWDLHSDFAGMPWHQWRSVRRAGLILLAVALPTYVSLFNAGVPPVAAVPISRPTCFAQACNAIPAVSGRDGLSNLSFVVAMKHCSAVQLYLFF